MTEQTPAPGAAEAPTPTLAEAARALRAGETTSVALVEACLARIARWEPRLHACVTVLGERALAEARRADEQLRARRARGPLHGLPLGLKDLIQTRGVRTTAGSRVLADWLPEEDATIVTRLAAAGAITLAKANTHEFAFGTVTPPTRNPWDLDHVPGGSSGGPAAGVAAGEFLGAVGTDTGGSIRIPAGWCGVTGLKPTYGLVSLAGVIPLSWSLDHGGPIARSVEDCALLLDALAGYDPADPASIEAPALDYVAALAAGRSPEDAVRGARIGLPISGFFDDVDAEVRAAVLAAAEVLAGLGARVAEVPMPAALDDLYAVYRAIQKPEAYVYHSERGWLTTQADHYSPAVLANITSGADYSAADYVRAQRARRAFTVALGEAMREVDALLVPTLVIPAPPVDTYDAAFVVSGRALVGGALRLTLPFDLAGLPALTMPCGFTTQGLPAGMQLVAGHLGEPTLLRLGHAYQRVSDWHRRQPPLR